MDAKQLVNRSKRLREVQGLIEATKDFRPYKTLGCRNNQTITLSVCDSLTIIGIDRGSELCKDIFKALEKEEKRVAIKIRETVMKD